ncbi:hypothetical protein CN918_27115 [Priestia megaterium]|nr:hypothetical protein CN918_27115 [Priestia megaterium]
MKIALSGPNELTEYDKLEIRSYMEAVINEHEISILAYRSIEKEVLKFFVEFEEHASKLSIYTFLEFSQLPSDIQRTIEYLQERGASYKTFYHNDLIVKREPYVNAWRYIMDENDAVVSFFNIKAHHDQRQKLMIPIDIATKSNKRPFIYTLPVYDSSILEQTPTDKIRLID